MDWIRFTCNNNEGLLNYDPSHAFRADFSKIDFEGGSPLQEAINYITYITKNFPEPYNLLVSGGIDSQAMLSAWIESKIPFNPISFVYNKTYNLHDLHTLNEFCKLHNIKPTLIDIDYFNFLKNDLINYATNYICNSPQITFYMKFCDLIPHGTVISSGSNVGVNGLRVHYSQLGLINYANKTKRNIIPYFLAASPKLGGSFFKTELQVESNIENDLLKMSGYSKRCLAMKEAGFNIIPALQKFTGFERFKKYYQKHKITKKHFAERMPRNGSSNDSNFDLMFRKPLYNINPYMDQIINDPPLIELYESYKLSKFGTLA